MQPVQQPSCASLKPLCLRALHHMRRSWDPLISLPCSGMIYTTNPNPEKYTCQSMPVNGGSFQEYYDGGNFTNWAQIRYSITLLVMFYCTHCWRRVCVEYFVPGKTLPGPSPPLSIPTSISLAHPDPARPIRHRSQPPAARDSKA